MDSTMLLPEGVEISFELLGGAVRSNTQSSCYKAAKGGVAVQANDFSYNAHKKKSLPLVMKTGGSNSLHDSEEFVSTAQIVS
jgi:hypothetical protein